MAQTKTSPRRGASSGSSRSRSTARASNARSSGRSSSGGSTKRSASPKRKQPKARAARSTRGGATRSANGKGTIGSVTDTVSSGAQNAGQRVATAVKKTRTPLIAGGAAIVGLAGVVALKNARSRRRKVFGVTMPRTAGLEKDARRVAGAVTDAAKRADQLGQRVSSVANSVQMVSETADKAAKKA
jgi:hypothetical protein